MTADRKMWSANKKKIANWEKNQPGEPPLKSSVGHTTKKHAEDVLNVLKFLLWLQCTRKLSLRSDTHTVRLPCCLPCPGDTQSSLGTCPFQAISQLLAVPYVILHATSLKQEAFICGTIHDKQTARLQEAARLQSQAFLHTHFIVIFSTTQSLR